jgi:hypothetical protein
MALPICALHNMDEAHYGNTHCMHGFMAAIKLRDRHKCRVSFHHRLDSLTGDDMKGRDHPNKDIYASACRPTLFPNISIWEIATLAFSFLTISLCVLDNSYVRFLCK